MSVSLLENDSREVSEPLEDDSSQDEYADVVTMVAVLRRLPADSDAYARQLERIVLRCCPLADRVARHFDRRGENLEDLIQVARVGLLQAVNRFDPERGSRFVAFALPTMMGELRRYFRDYGWKVHVPRRIRDRQHDIACATAYLTNDLRRAPSIEELAEELEIDRDQVVESIVAAKAYQPQSLDVNVSDDDARTQALGDSLGEMDAGFDRVTDRESVRSLLAALPRREQKVLYLRYFGAMTQRQIADSIGVSQMHVSRILDRTLRDLRAQVGCA